MKITFLGAAHEVTGSLTLIELNNEKLLIDCGMEQGRDIYVNQQLPVAAAEIDCVLLTHAHIDHAGNLPLLYKNGFRGKVYATTSCCGLCDIMLRDCAHIQKSDTSWQNRKRRRSGEPEIEPLYTMDDVDGLLKCLRPVDYGEKLRILEGVDVRFVDMGHLLGSAAIEVWLTEGKTEKKFVFSGDVGNIDKPILNDPVKIREADYVMIESTYGDRLHTPEKRDHAATIADVIKRTLDRGGNVIIPASAIGRLQEILYLIRVAKHRGMIKGHDHFRVVVDSPLANEATNIFLQADDEVFDEEASELMQDGVDPLWFDGLEASISSKDSNRLNSDDEPKVIIASSAMCEGGRIQHHLKHNLWRPECTILFVSYQSAGTLGSLISSGAKQVKLFGEEIAVNAEICEMHGSSGHADRDGLVNWLSGFEKKPEIVFVNHGDPEACDEFTKYLREKLGYNAYAPYSGTEFDIAECRFIVETDGVLTAREIAKRSERARIAEQKRRITVYNKLMETVNKLRRLAVARRDAAADGNDALNDDIIALIEKWGNVNERKENSDKTDTEV